MNRHVEDTRDQILNTLQILSGCGLTRITKDVLSTFDQDCEILTWNNHVSGRHNAGKSFTTLNQYISIYETGAYHCILFDEDSRNKKAIMRSPLRFDFDPSNTSDLHPATHVHMQHADCRISAKRPICFNTFIKFVFKNFYPNCCPSILDDLKRLNYSGFDIFDKAVICL